MAKKATLVCRPCGTRVMVSDLGAAVVECYECGLELQPSTAGSKKLVAAKAAKKPAKKTAAKKKPAAKAPPASKTAARKAAPKKK